MKPLALSSKSVRASFGIEDDTLDFFEYYNLAYNPNFLMVHDATKIFTNLYKDNREIHPFGMVYSKILREFPDCNVYELVIDDEKNKTTLRQFCGSGKYKSVKKVKSDKNSKNKQIVFIENRHNSFAGHYGVIFSDGGNHHYFDSMLHQDGTSAYFESFTTAFHSYFPCAKPIIVDSVPFSFEIVGGEVSIENPYLYSLQNSTDFFVKQTLLGVDTQNPYCFMWGMLWAMMRLCGNKKTDEIVADISSNSIIPVSLIKYFSSFVIGMMKDHDPIETVKVNRERKRVYKLLTESPRFYSFFNTFVSNASRYDECFDLKNSEFKMYTIPTGEITLRSQKSLSILEIIDDISAFCANPSYISSPPSESSSSSESSLSSPSTKMKVSFDKIHEMACAVITNSPNDDLAELADTDWTNQIE